MSKTSRRAVLAGAATLPALSLPALANGPHPDAELLALKPEWQQALDEADALTERHSAESDAYNAVRAPMPDACRPRPSDVDGLGPDFNAESTKHDDSYFAGYYVDRFRTLGETRLEDSVARGHDGTILIRRVERNVDRARVEEIITAFDEWNAKDKALRLQYQIDLHDDDGDEVYGAVTDLEDEIMAMPAHTLEGLAFKVTVALYEIDCSRSLAEAETKECDGPTGYLLSLARDILAMRTRS